MLLTDLLHGNTQLAKLLRHELLTRDVIHADETSLRLLDTRKGGKSCSGWLWAYVSGERSGPPVVCFDSQTGRALRYPEAWLQGWHGGTLVSDGYNVYKSLADSGKQRKNELKSGRKS